jgi:hypothetical protein
MSFKPEVMADSSGKFYDNGCSFPTREEAEGYVKDLFSRWTAVREFRVVESDEPANYKWTGKLESIN